MTARTSLLVTCQRCVNPPVVPTRRRWLRCSATRPHQAPVTSEGRRPRQVRRPSCRTACRERRSPCTPRRSAATPACGIPARSRRSCRPTRRRPGRPSRPWKSPPRSGDDVTTTESRDVMGNPNDHNPLQLYLYVPAPGHVLVDRVTLNCRRDVIGQGQSSSSRSLFDSVVVVCSVQLTSTICRPICLHIYVVIRSRARARSRSEGQHCLHTN